MAEARPPIQEVTTPEFIRVFGDISAAKRLAMNELMPAVAELLKQVPESMKLGVEEWRKDLQQGR
jgi:hypothetical protein